MANAASPGDIESLARQYWDAWGSVLGTAPQAGAWTGTGSWPPAGSTGPAAFDWYARMQQLAAQFADGGSANDIASAWRTMLGGHDGGAFAGVLHGMPGGLGALAGDWPEQVRPFVEAMVRPLRQQAAEWLGRPGLGPAREHQQRLQALAAAWQEWEQHNEAFNALLSRVGQDAFARFERMLLQHESPGRQLATARALFDLWIDAAEEAWAEAALSEDYQQHYAALTNALMRVRQGVQEEVERMGALLGLPGRTELDAVHRKVAELERSVHALRRVAGLPQGVAATPGAQAAPRRRRTPSPADVGSAPAKTARAAGATKKRKPATAAAKGPAAGNGEAGTGIVKAAKVARSARQAKPAKPAKTAKTAKTAKAPARRQSGTAPGPAAGNPARTGRGTARGRGGRGQ